MSRYILLRIKAQIIGIRAEDFITEQVSDRDEQYTGRCEVFIPEEDVKEFKKKGIPVDKAYNMTPNRTKVILLGDPNQIDRTFLDERTNGLSYASEHMKGSGLCWQITLNASECGRSELAMDAVRRL
nr:PhoH family protein [Enterocloster clostridioformis]